MTREQARTRWACARARWSPRSPMLVVGAFHHIFAALFAGGFARVYPTAWEFAFGTAGVLCWGVAVWPRARWLRTGSGVAAMGVAVARGVTLLVIADGSPVAAGQWILIAYLEFLLWPHILPPFVRASDLELPGANQESPRKVS